MMFRRIRLENWKNFQAVDVPLKQRMFVVGPNASGKSNLLDAFRFLRDIADPQAGFQRAIQQVRRGVSQIRSLHARRQSHVGIEVEVELADGKPWTYRLEFTQDNQRRAIIQKERVKWGAKVLLDRPDQADIEDQSRLTQTALEQVNVNKPFRGLQEFFAKVRYLHIVPQLVRDPNRSVGITGDPYGGDFLEQVARTVKKTRASRLQRITRALRVAVPQLEKIQLKQDDRGIWHMQGLYSHWRPNAGWQNEVQFSDGTLRLLGLLWAFLDGSHPVLLEEPELSLHPAVVRHIPSMMARLGRKNGRQVILSTHSPELLGEKAIDLDEVLLLSPSSEDTKVELASADRQIAALLDGGLTVAEAVLPRVAPKNADQLSLFGE